MKKLLFLISLITVISCQDKEYCYECTLTRYNDPIKVNVFEVCHISPSEIRDMEITGTTTIDGIRQTLKCEVLY